MMTVQIVVSALLFAHGAIHLIGVVRSWKHDHPWFAALFFGAFLALGAAAVLLVTQKDALWWKAALVGLALSQAAILTAWSEAKLGTIANAFLLLPVVIGASHARFEQKVDDEMTTLVARQADRQLRDERPNVVDRGELDRLPKPVRHWLLASGVVGLERARVVRLQQRGELRTAVDQPWLHVRAEQTFSVDEPAFIWRVETKMMHDLVPIVGRDRYAHGKGEMLIKAASILSVADACDEKTTQGAMLRFLGEIVWFPSAALSPYIIWEPIDETHARATMHDAQRTATGVFGFDHLGHVTGFRAMRYMGSGEDEQQVSWYAPMTESRSIRGVVVPVRGSVVWELPEGDFDYYRWEIVDIETNGPAPRRAPNAPIALAERPR